MWLDTGYNPDNPRDTPTTPLEELTPGSPENTPLHNPWKFGKSSSEPKKTSWLQLLCSVHLFWGGKSFRFLSDEKGSDICDMCPPHFFFPCAFRSDNGVKAEKEKVIFKTMPLTNKAIRSSGFRIRTIITWQTFLVKLGGFWESKKNIWVTLYTLQDHKGAKWKQPNNRDWRFALAAHKDLRKSSSIASSCIFP